MLYRGSYLNGFAPRDFEPAYPELWKGCVGAWCPSLGPTGGVLRDWSGRQNHGTLAGATLDTVWANQQGYCLLLDGTNDHVTCGDNLSKERTDAFCLSIWVKTTSGSPQFLLGKQQDNSPYRGYGIYANIDSAGSTSAGKIAVMISSTFGVNAISVGSTSSVSVNDGARHHIVMTYDGSSTAAGVLMYFDGSLVATTAGQDNLSATIVNAAPFTIGSRSGTELFLSGSVDDASNYNRMLRTSEVSLLYSNGRGRGIAYSFNQPRGSLTPGESSGSSDSTFPGLAWRALKRWRFVVRAGVDGNWPRVT